MVPQLKWTDRKFDRQVPCRELPALIERLYGTPARLEEKINNAPFMLLTQQVNNKWSIQEHAGHLIDLEILFCNRLDDFEAGKTMLTAADMENKKTYHADYNNHNINAVLKIFRQSRQATVNRISKYDEALVSRTSMHPRLRRPMNVADIVYFFAEHDDHHLAAISRIIQDAG